MDKPDVGGVILRKLKFDDWEDIKSIYEEGIATGNATFETSSGTWKQWDKNHLKELRFVAEIDKEVAGWVALSPVSGRCVYGGVAETSIYVKASFSGRGIGSLLLNHIIEQSEKSGIWTLQAGIFTENKRSIKLHEKHGFRVVGVREKLGKLYNSWKDVVLMERRSRVTGVQ